MVLGGRRRVLPLGGGWAGALPGALRGLCRLQEFRTQVLSFSSTPEALGPTARQRRHGLCCSRLGGAPCCCCCMGGDT